MSSLPTNLHDDVVQSDPFFDNVLGLPCLTLVCGRAEARVTRQGAQVISWRASDGRERFYLSTQTGGMKREDALDAATLAQAIRGGVPICFPQFSVRGAILKHGFARALPWTLESLVNHDAERSVAVFSLRDDARTRSIWPYAFLVQLTVTLEPQRLMIALQVTNTGEEAWTFTGALHSYLLVDEIAKTELIGLRGTHYEDATADNVDVIDPDDSLRIGEETDRVYLSPPASLQLVEEGKPALHIGKTGFTDTVVWNPGPELIQTLKDMPDSDWQHMLCVEAACASAPVIVQPGETWIGSQVLSIAG
ncbi:D-hexose-6-phosphate mutarotase [Oxalicibacterium faecigallinarum]|uniref:Putative glucose-6-phosphate 1-epimerase n=1 Tax=Oxalicibacterium faecigallinarum TaxID=573741 RepID=A0A8J3ARF4_9BURK|nr:D-hexose-6-phosphate mutarotase [Oxalicibacterium faecigallinarum]GGI19122.1 D-hexose-6-phosphate mutarotase [Oxalicibacterium faecigallinarum]